MTIWIIEEHELRACVDLDDEALRAVEAGFSALARGDVTQPPILSVPVPEHHGEVDVKSAYVRGFDSFAVKISSGFFDNPKIGLSTGSGMMILLDAKTGHPRAVLLDNGYLTDIRTALAGAIAAEHLAPARPTTVGIIGAGSQARYQLAALCRVRVFERVLLYGRDEAKAERCADDMRRAHGRPVATADLATLCAESDIIVTTTPSRTPLVRAEHLRPGQHVTAMGSDAEDKQEIDASALERADLVVVDVLAQSRRLGELRRANPATISRAVELGAITSGAHPGRRSEDEITICDLTGTGVQDTMIARLAYGRAVARELGTETQTVGGNRDESK